MSRTAHFHAVDNTGDPFSAKAVTFPVAVGEGETADQIARNVVDVARAAFKHVFNEEPLNMHIRWGKWTSDGIWRRAD